MYCGLYITGLLYTSNVKLWFIYYTLYIKCQTLNIIHHTAYTIQHVACSIISSHNQRNMSSYIKQTKKDMYIGSVARYFPLHDNYVFRKQKVSLTSPYAAVG